MSKNVNKDKYVQVFGNTHSHTHNQVKTRNDLGDPKLLNCSVYTHTYTHIPTHTHIHTHLHTHAAREREHPHAPQCGTCIHTHTHIYTHTHTHIYTHTPDRKRT